MNIKFNGEKERLNWNDKRLNKRVKSLIYLVWVILTIKYSENYAINIIKIRNNKNWREINIVIESESGKPQTQLMHDACKSINKLIKYDDKNTHKTATFCGEKYIHLRVCVKFETMIC